MQKTLYFVRHCEPNYDNHNDKERELTAKGQADTRLINDFLKKLILMVSMPAPLSELMIRFIP